MALVICGKHVSLAIGGDIKVDDSRPQTMQNIGANWANVVFKRFWHEFLRDEMSKSDLDGFANLKEFREFAISQLQVFNETQKSEHGMEVISLWLSSFVSFGDQLTIDLSNNPYGGGPFSGVTGHREPSVSSCPTTVG